MKCANHVRRDTCPLCTSEDVDSIGTLAYGDKVDFSTVEIELDRIPELWKCRRCGSGFVQNIIDEETARHLYSMGHAGERWASESFDETKTSDVAGEMAELFKRTNAVLDIGCNTGELLDFAHGFGCKTSGVELSSSSREVLQKKGHLAYSSMEQTPGGYDVITAFDLIEHLYDVPGFLAGCAEKLAEKGRLVVMTGDIDCFGSRLARNGWWYVQLAEHIVFPSKRYFSDYSGLKIEKWIAGYASKSFEYPKWTRVRALISALLGRQPNNGWPPLLPDHALIFLKK